MRQRASAPPRAGTLGRYRVVAELAQGGMGVVYLALMRGPGAFNKLLVLKELKPDLFDDPGVVTMFMEEARLAACLSHPNVVQTIEAGTDGDRHFIVMEHVEGQSLYRVGSRAQKLGLRVPFELQAAVLCGVLEGLAYAHAATDYEGKSLGIVHRDVSPHNVLIGYDGQVKLVDFGIAKATGSLTDTRLGLLKGRVAYMAPEQAAGGNVDARADLFSVGIMLWEAAKGRRFWSGIGSDVQVLRALLMGDEDAAHAREMGEVDPDLRAIIARATAFDPSQRPANAKQLLQELRTALAKRQPPPFDAPQIGRFVQGLFVEERGRLQAAIAAAVEFDVPPAEIDGTREASGRHVPPLWQTSPGSFFPQTLPPRAPAQPAGLQSGAHGPRPLEGRWLVAISVVVLLGSVATLVGLLSLRRSTAAMAQVVVPVPASASGAAPIPADPIQDETMDEPVHVLVRASPARAKIVIDRNLVFENPCVATLPRDGARHTVHVEAEGYSPRDDTFEAHGDVTLVIALEPRKAVPHAVTVVVHPAGASPPPPPTSPPPGPPQPMTSPPEPPSPAQPVPAPAGVPQRRINTDNPYNR